MLWAPQWAFLVTVAAVAVLCFREYSESGGAPGIRQARSCSAYAAGLLLLLLPGKYGPLLILIAILAMALALRRG